MGITQDWLPPALLRWVRRTGIGRRGIVRFEGEFTTWEEACVECSGYDSDEILAKVLDSTLRVMRGEAAFERDSVLFDKIDYAWPVLAGLMWAAARNGGKLNVLDFGGALGSSYFQNREFLKALPDVRWSVVEQAHYVSAGQSKIQDEQLRFYETVEECLDENKPNVVLLSSVLQYLESPGEIIRQLSIVGAKDLIIDRTPFSTQLEDRLMIQQVPASIYDASYPMWVFSRSKFMKILSPDWKLIASNLSPEGLVQAKGGFELSFQGMVLESRQ